MSDIEFADVAKVYPDGTRAVDSLDLEIQDGEFMVFVGPSGCGKTTALRMVAGLEEISDGEIRIGDEVVNDLAPRDRDRCGRARGPVGEARRGRAAGDLDGRRRHPARLRPQTDPGDRRFGRSPNELPSHMGRKACAEVWRAMLHHT